VEERSPLDAEIRRRIALAGPMPVAEYMALCLFDPAHGYYTTHDPFGARGDFITAPEVSQMFGELIGLWVSAVWKQMGAPENVRLIELGPGRGTMMKDALRAVQIVPEFRAAIVAHLVEVSPLLRAQQEKTLEDVGVPVFWHAALAEVPKGPAIILANEFFDALPVNQAIKTERGWHERRIQIDSTDQLAFTIAPETLPFFQTLLPPALQVPRAGAIFEWRADAAAIELGRRIADGRGAALVIDYGHTETGLGETLQAVGQHAYADPLTFPGSLDLTAHVDFQSLGRAIEAMGTAGFGPIEQSLFLRRLGIEQRAAALKAKAAHVADIDQELARLIGHNRTAMGELFKVAAFVHPSVGVPPGFAA
jgi:NADH dehydrogenase [ubiquinone] 1 alpha subcomplex assembly factor 7